ncbi:unnamed protein product [Echinostoma caproni]|uniref:KxDL domain-containing protein n=1 Tax=Echinostoma caproni TaxID=27848 RepID=A0A183ALM6_9TREM|nr:unnamed protein product [Echinostoma caproni]
MNEAHSASDVLFNAVTSLINSDDVQQIIVDQEMMLNKFEKTNEMLRTVSELSVHRYKILSAELLAHSQKLTIIRKDLNGIFKRIRTLRAQLDSKFPLEMQQVSEHLTFPEDSDEEGTTGMPMDVNAGLTLTAFAHLLIFDLLYIIVALTSLWAKRKHASLDGYTLGYERFEVVAVFSATILAIASSFFEIKEAVERFFEPSHVQIHYLLAASLVALIVHIVAIYGVENPAFSHVILASGSSWLQEHTTDISRTLCRIVPGLARILLPRVNPFALVGVSAASVVAAVYWVMRASQNSEAIHTHHEHSAPHEHAPDPLPDTIGGMVISLMLFGTMVPMMLYSYPQLIRSKKTLFEFLSLPFVFTPSGRILLQTVPAHLVGPLDKAFREASTVDGVLELRNEHVWSVGFGNLAGSLYVRVRRDANEQLVLAHVHNRLSSLVKYLTVQVRLL